MVKKRAAPHAMLTAAVPTETYDRLCEIADRRRISLSEATRVVLIRGLIGINQDAAARARLDAQEELVKIRAGLAETGPGALGAAQDGPAPVPSSPGGSPA